MKIRFEKTGTEFGKEKLVKWTKVSLVKIWWTKFKKWAENNAFGLWLGAGATLVTVAVILGYMIYEIRSL